MKSWAKARIKTNDTWLFQLGWFLSHYLIDEKLGVGIKEDKAADGPFSTDKVSNPYRKQLGMGRLPSELKRQIMLVCWNEEWRWARQFLQKIALKTSNFIVLPIFQSPRPFEASSKYAAVRNERRAFRGWRRNSLFDCPCKSFWNDRSCDIAICQSWKYEIFLNVLQNTRLVYS